MTVIRGTELGKALGQSAARINRQIEALEQQAKVEGISMYDMRDTSGNWVLTPLLAAQAQVLHALVLVNQRRS